MGALRPLFVQRPPSESRKETGSENQNAWCIEVAMVASLSVAVRRFSLYTIAKVSSKREGDLVMQGVLLVAKTARLQNNRNPAPPVRLSE